MGTKQLLLIVLAVIVVGTAIFVGMQSASTADYEAEKDRLINITHRLLQNAETYRKKAEALGGGGGETYEGWNPPADMLEGEEVTWTTNKVHGGVWMASVRLRSKYRFSANNNKRIRIVGRTWHNGRQQILMFDGYAGEMKSIYKNF